MMRSSVTVSLTMPALTPWASVFRALRRPPLMYTMAPMIRAGETPPRVIDGAAASTSSSGSQPPAAMHRLRAEPVHAADRAALACCATRAPKSAMTTFSPPQAVTYAGWIPPSRRNQPPPPPR